jgi:RNA polymerase sigma-70 factor (ECF subfamily)
MFAGAILAVPVPRLTRSGQAGHAGREFNVSTPPDSDLLARIAAGDRDAFGLFYDRYAPVLFGFGIRILKDGRDAEDVLQEALVQVWRDARGFDATRASVKTWLFTIVRSRALYRWRSRRSLDQHVLPASEEAIDRERAAAGGQEEAVRRDYVGRWLRRLPKDERAVLFLAYYDGYTQEEIAVRLKQPLGTVKSRTRSGLAKLKVIAIAEGAASRG